jgi:hypothetical protein
MWVSATDYGVARLASSGLSAIGGEATDRFMASHGLTDPESQAKIKARTNYYASMVPENQTTFAMGESVAHLNALWLRGELERHLDADGIHRFSRVRTSNVT